MSPCFEVSIFVMSECKKIIQISKKWKLKLCAGITKKETYKKGSYLILFFSNQIGCLSSDPIWIGDGYCDDETNNAGCHFDGGDCCGNNIDTQYCNDCICF